MSDNNTGSNEPMEPGDAVHEEQQSPKRKVGTPTQGGRLLATDESEPAPQGAGAELDEAAAKRAERVVAAFFLLAALASVGFIAAYVWSGTQGPNGMHGLDDARASNYALGACMTVAMLAMAIGVTIWVRRLMTSKQIVQQRGNLHSDEATRAEFETNFMAGAADSAVTRRPLLRRTLLLAAAPLGLAPLVLLRDLGPLPEKRLRHTFWGEAVKEAKKHGRPGVRLVVDGTDRALRVSDFATPGSMITVLPEGVEKSHHALNEIAKSVTILINVPADKFKPVKGRENWHVGGIVAYSKICTHVGCPAALYEQTTHHILCPCHQSTFDATDGAKVIFGPAARPLPQLPLSVDDEGYLIATDDFPEPIGPSFWERG
ncbi:MULTISPECIES: cytochrome bc1 complex Rieske iron-sulfur subunit [Thermomonospora]|uniref:Cytochrome bc1 complex Rieske iron-sulfur subunit n=1 Tax=Thermomonospora cellulosilytica TaxID=1411118 RepID=A0A7W3N3B9_9ACTN|nr:MULTISPECIES: Rieske (2Fe-2S) protein [Thermomonospora]MBA9006667.1 ubiquinol-cytochrome c reductase iron-sulfur subunit [Thermomonospora cellulosilytica]